MEAIVGVTIIASVVIVICLLEGFGRAGRRGTPSSTIQEAPEQHETPECLARAAPARPKPRPQTMTGTAWVIDGDTIVIDKVHLRLFGIDAPELDQPYGRKAKSAMIGLCKGHKVRAEITENDHYDRCVARCFLPDGRDLSAELVKMGLAIDWPKYSGGAYRRLEQPDVRRRLWRAHNRQMGRPLT